jgi:hypothetical protein
MAPAVPLLSACLIVKDEEDLLPECLDSLAGAVDEIVVYDTGSTDRTIEIAEAAGAVVLRGYWDDDFSRARNAALDACTGRWILHIDADERLVGDGETLRRRLTSASEEQLNLRIDNTAPDDSGIGFSHVAARLFLRKRGRWLGRLHEQVVPRPGQPNLRLGSIDQPRLLHIGYRQDLVDGRDKLARNLRVAQVDVTRGAEHPPHALLSLGRALAATGRREEALERFVEAIGMCHGEVGVLRQVLRNGAQMLLELGRPNEAITWTAELRATPGTTAMADYLESLAQLNLGNHTEALELLSGLDADVVDEDGFRIPPSFLSVTRVLGLLGEGRWSEATAAFRAMAADPEVTVPLWAPLVAVTAQAGESLAALAVLVRPEELTSVLGQLLNVKPVIAEQVAESIWQRTPGMPALLAFGARVAPGAGLERAMEWSARLRAAGIEGLCPVITIAQDEDQPPLNRVQAACVAAAGFGDLAGRDGLVALAPVIPIEDMTEALVQVASLAPAELPAFVAAAAVDPHRCLVIARSLHELGAPNEALAVFEHGFAQPGPRDEVVDEAAAWLRGLGHVGRATQLLAAS